jgi:GNAT superfamily N-acetyltransferase
MDGEDQRDRAERVEMAAWRDLFGAAPARVRTELGLGFTATCGALALRAPGVDSLLFNRVLGLGRRGPVLPPLFDELMEGYARAGIRRVFVHVPADPEGPPQLELRRSLLAAGLLRFHRSWVKLSRGGGRVSCLDREPSPRAPLARPAGPSDAATVAAIIADGLAIPPPGRRVLEAAVVRAGWHAFLAELDGRPISAGLMFERDGVAYLAGGSTLPEYRRRGGQMAVLRARLERARALGCGQVTSETGEEVRGEPNSSFDNMVRLGFRPIGVWDNYARPATRWASA